MFLKHARRFSSVTKYCVMIEWLVSKGEKYPNLLSGGGGSGGRENRLSMVYLATGRCCSKCDVKHKFFDGKGGVRHTQAGLKPL